MKRLMSGNEAIARGAYEYGVRFAAGYPGTPSTEIMEEFSKYPGVYAEWSPNEKVAVEVCLGAAFAGAKSMAVMKHVGVNVAADPIFTASYTGTNGALVIVSCDDPSMHSSQNEQDNRHYARSAKIPMLEPSDSQEAKVFIKHAFEISRKFDTPVFLRSTTRLSHSKSIVEIEGPDQFEEPLSITFNPDKYVMVPINARKRRIILEERLNNLKSYSENYIGNKLELNSTDIGIITSGMSYNYAKEVFPDVSYLKLGLIYPLPINLIKKFASIVKKLYVIEELDPFIEEQVRALGIQIVGKEIFPYTNEFSPEIIENAFKIRKVTNNSQKKSKTIPERPPNLCPGCPHRGLFYALGKQGVYVSGDIGCYTLAYLKPLSGMHSCICMGASIGIAHGMSKALGDIGKGRVVGVIGDSTFIHSGITSLLNLAYNKSNAVIVICDNGTTAMTGMQDHPSTGETLQHKKTLKIDLKKLVLSLGIETVLIVDPYDLDAVESAILNVLSSEKTSVIISQRECILLKRRTEGEKKSFFVEQDKCIGCRRCLKLGCPPISWMSEQSGSKSTKGQKFVGVAVIDESRCAGCGLCAKVCKEGAILRKDAVN